MYKRQLQGVQAGLVVAVVLIGAVDEDHAGLLAVSYTHLDVYKRQGLHQRDNDKLLAPLKRLRDLGNTLIVVEHDEDTMRAADYLIDLSLIHIYLPRQPLCHHQGQDGAGGGGDRTGAGGAEKVV